MSARAVRSGAIPFHPREVDDALYGRVEPSAERLVALICATNPTGRGLSRADTARRYELKSALQSRLIERHGAEVTLVEDERAGFVLLRHRPTGLSASHARVDSLSPRARAWVQLQLDLRSEHVIRQGNVPVNDLGPRRPDVAAARPKRAARDPLDEAAAALARFDYERAGVLLRRAFDARGGDAASARALASFLVDDVAQYGEALALEPRCAEEARRDEVVRGAWALAAANLGDPAAALRHAAGLAGERAAVVYVSLAAAALAGGALDEAAQHAACARRLCPGAPGLAGAEARVSAEVARRLRDEEDAAEGALARGDIDGAEALARAVLQRWPESPRARAVARGARDARRARAVELAARAFEAALARDELAEAARHVAALRELVADVAPYGRRLERAREARRAAMRAQDDAAAAAVVAAIGPALAGWAPAFLRLPLTARELVRRTDAARPWRVALAACEALTGGAEVDVARAVEAVTALLAATELAARDPDAAALLLRGHERVLDRAPETQRAAQQVLDARRAHAAARAETCLRRAEEARGGGRWEEALALLGELARPDATPAALRSRVEGARAALARALAFEREAQIRPTAAALPEVAAALRAIGASRAAPWAEGAAERWAEAHAALRARAASRWHVTVVHNVDDEPTNPCTLPLITGRIAREVVGTRWPFTMSTDRLIAVCEYDLARGVAVTRVAVAADAWLTRVSVEADDATLTLRGANGVDLTIDRGAWTVRDLTHEAPLPREGYEVAGRLVWPGSPWRWVVSTNGTHLACDRMDGARSFVCATEPTPVRGHGAPPGMFVRCGGDRDWTLLDAAGEVALRWRAPSAFVLAAASPSPGGAGWILTLRDEHIAEKNYDAYSVMHLGADGRGLTAVAHIRTQADAAVASYTSADGGCWILVGTRLSPQLLVALRAREGRVEEAWRCEVLQEVVCVPVERGARVLLVSPAEGAFAVEQLSVEEAPSCGETVDAPEDEGPSPEAPGPGAKIPADLQVYVTVLQAAHLDRAEFTKLGLAAHAGEMVARCGSSAVGLLGLCEIYIENQFADAFERAHARLAAVLPGDPRVPLMRARWCSFYGTPAEVLDAVGPIARDALTPRDRQALLTVLHRAHVELGADDAARALLPALEALSPPADYQLMVDACAPLPEALDLDELLTASSALPQRRRLLALADRAIERGDPRLALRAIVSSGIYRSGDRHANARVCRALLELPDATAAERLDGLAFISRYLSRASSEHGALGKRRFIHPSPHLPEATIASIRRDAESLLALATLPFEG
jgi:hypothetical protein